MKANKHLTTAEIANISGGKCLGDETILIKNLNRIKNAAEGELTFIASEKYLKYFETTPASAIMIPEGYDLPKKDNCCYISCQDPYQGFLKVVAFIAKERNSDLKPGIAKTAIIGEGTKIADSAYIADRVVIGNNCTIGANTVIKPNAVVYDNVTIGEDCEINSCVNIYDNVVIKNRVQVHGGATIGSDGFGNIEQKDGSWIKIPHTGNVIVNNDVEVGANAVIDRAFVGSTIIEKGVKIGALVIIAHNCEVGEHTAFAAQCGVAGSTNIGKRNRFAGQVGIAGHIDFTDDVTIYAKSGVAQSVKEKGIYLGTPILPRLEQIKIFMSLKKLPDLIRRVGRLEKENINK